MGIGKEILLSEIDLSVLQIPIEQISPVLASIFADYDFRVEGGPVDASIVFAGEGFLPVIAHIARNRFVGLLGEEGGRHFGGEVDRLFSGFSSEPDDGALFGVRVAERHGAVADRLALLIFFFHPVCCEMFGPAPCRVDLDGLYEYGFSADLQNLGAPVLSQGGEA